MPYSVTQRKPDVTVLAASGTVTTTALDAGATAGGTLLLVITWSGVGSITSAPSGFTLDTPAFAGQVKAAVYRKTAAGGETSTSFTLSSAALVRYEMLEVDGLDTAAPVDTAPQFASEATATTTVDTAGGGTNNASSVYDGLLLTVHAGYITTSTTVPTWSGFTQGAAQDESDAGVASASAALGAALGLSSTVVPTVYDVSATASATMSNVGGLHVVYACAGARRAADLVDMFGAEHGTMTGVTADPNATARQPFSAVNGSVTCDAAAARTGGFGYLFVGSAAAANASPLVRATGTRVVDRVCFRFPTLPSQDVEIAARAATVGGTTVVFRYLGATNPGKIGCKMGTGTEQVSDASITANQWLALDYLLDARAATYTADWMIDYNAELSDTTGSVTQTQATGAGTAGSSWSQSPRYGWTNTATATLHMDDAVYSTTFGHYPLGDHRIYGLKVDPASTPALGSGSSSANYGVMTANGTIGAWSATGARDAVDDIPPVVGASADGAVAVTAEASSSTQYAEFPVEAHDGPSNGEAIRGAKVYWALWAASGTAATIRLAAFDGTTSYGAPSNSDVDYGQDNSTTAAVWVVGIVKPAGARMAWTQAKLDALTVRFGSADATPDIGIHAFVVEAAFRAGQTQTMFGAPGDVQVSANLDPDSAGIISLTTQGSDYKGTALSYDVSGSPTSATVPAGTSRTDVLGAPDAPTVDYVAIYPDPEGVADA